MAMEPFVWHPETSEKWEVLRVGSEPIVLSEFENGMTTYSVITSGWAFEREDKVLVLNDGAVVGFAVPGAILKGPPMEHGFVKIAGYTLSELRALALA